MSDFQIIFPGAEKAEFVQCERDPAPLGPQEVSGRTLYSLVSNGTEMNIYLGNYVAQGLSWGQFPFVPGYAAAFEVDAVGPDVMDLSPGDVCFCMGPHRTHQRLAREAVIPLPEGMDPKLAPFARLMNVSMTTLTTTTARPPGLVVVTGLGAVGLLGALVFQRCGYRVIAVDPVKLRRDTAVASGLRDVRPAVPVDDPAVTGRVSLVLECSAHETAVLDAVAVIEQRGEVVLVGVPMVRRTEIYAQEILNRVFRKKAVLRSGNEWEVPRYATPFRKNSNYGNMTAGLQWLHEGSIPVEAIFEMREPTDPQSLYDDVLHQRTNRTAVLLDWTQLTQ